MNEGLGKFYRLGDILNSPETEGTKRCIISTGFRDLDGVINGFYKQEFIIMASRHNIGKTALALNLAINISLLDKKVAFFNLDLDGQKQHKNKIESFSKLPLYFFDYSTIKLEELCKRITEIKDNENVDFIIVDSIQKIKASPSRISRMLKVLARQLDIPILATSLLSTRVDKRRDTTPRLSDLRGGGNFEDNADLVLMLDRNISGDPKRSSPIILEIYVSKNRHGPRGKLSLFFQKSTCKFVELKTFLKL